MFHLRQNTNNISGIDAVMLAQDNLDCSFRSAGSLQGFTVFVQTLNVFTNANNERMHLVPRISI